MATVREITTLFNFKPKLGGLKRSIISVDKLKAGLKRLGIGVIAAGGALFALAKTTANFGDNIAKTSQKIGLSTDALQELIFASKLSGVEQTTLEGAIKRLSRGMLEASMGVAEYADTYKDLGIDVEDGNGKLKTSDAIIEELADKLAAMEDGTKKTALAQEFFGRAGAELIPLLNSGSKGIRKMRKEARDLGLIMSQKATKASEAFNDELLRTSQVVLALKRRIGLALLPMIQKLSKSFRKWVSENKKLIAQRLDKIINVIAFALGFIGKLFLNIGKFIFNFVEALIEGEKWAIALGVALAALVAIKGLAALAVNIKALGTALLFIGKSPQILIALAAIAGIAFLIEAASKDANATIEDLDRRIKDKELRLKKTLDPKLSFGDPGNIPFFRKEIKVLKERRKLLQEQAGGATVGSITNPASINKGGGNVSSIGRTVNINVEVNANSVQNPEKVGKIVAEKLDQMVNGKLRNRLNPQLAGLDRA